MTRAEQKRFVREVLRNAKAYIYTKEIPSNWEGVELRWYIARCVGCLCEDYYAKKDHKAQVREYRNDLLVNPL